MTTQNELIIEALNHARDRVTESYRRDRAEYIAELNRQGKIYSMFDPHLTALQNEHELACAGINDQIESLRGE